MIEKIMLDMLTKGSVSLKKQTYTIVNGAEYAIGESWRVAYINNTKGREQVQNEVAEPYKTAIFSIWGETPTIADIEE